MEIIEGKLKRWGNSFGIIVPSETIAARKLKENGKIRYIILMDSSEVLKETFGIGKGKLTKSGQQIKDELRKELYN